jgi:hypothetical protein
LDYGLNWIDPTNQIVINNLSTGIAYSMWYYAVTATGESPIFVASVASVSSTPNAPIIDMITPSSDGTIFYVDFTPPTYTGLAIDNVNPGTISNYTYTINNGLDYFVFDPAQTGPQLVITGGVLGRIYYVVIAAINEQGTGDTSLVTSIQTFIPCFAKGSKILTNQGYICIEELKVGDMVKTLNDGYLPVHSIGNKEIMPPQNTTEESRPYI